jgi:hypothetical protein
MSPRYIEILVECHFRNNPLHYNWVLLEQLDTGKMLEKGHTHGLLSKLDPWDQLDIFWSSQGKDV